MNYGYIKAMENCSKERSISINKQLNELTTLGITKIYIDIITKEKNNKEKLYILIDNLQKGETLVITKLSRIADNFNELSELCNALDVLGVTLEVLDIGIIVPISNKITNELCINAIKEFEKDIKYERICNGHLKSKKNKQSRSTKYSKKQLSDALRLRDRNTFSEIASITGISKSTLLRASKNMQL